MIVLQRVIVALASLFVMGLIIDLVRRRKLREEYAMLWLAAGLTMLICACYSRIVDTMAGLVGIQHPAYAMFVLAILVGIVLAIHFTVVLSKLTAQNWRLTQEVGMLRAELEEAKKEART